MVIDSKTKKVQKRTTDQVSAILNQIKWYMSR
jgi:phage-related protein